MAVSVGVISMSAQAFLILSLICCSYCAKLPAAEQQQQPHDTGSKSNGVITDGGITLTNNVPASGLRHSLPIVASTDDLEIVAHTGSEGLGRQKRYIGWGRRPNLRYNKATSVFDHDSLFNRIHNNFDKRAGPEAPISSFRELRMKQKTPNIQLLLPHLQMRSARIPAPSSPDGDADDDMERGKLTQEDLEALAYLLEGDIQ